MTKALLLFVAAPGVGAYINVMANSVNRYDVDRIALVHVNGSPSGEQINFEDFANRTLWDVLSGLVEGVYRETDYGTKGYRESPVPEAKDCEAYKRLKQVFGSSHFLEKVNYQFLRDDIASLKSKYGADAIIDLSGVPKRVSIDVVTACLAVGMSNIMIFELKKPSRGVNALYHNLKDSDYEHIVLPNWEPLIGNIKFFSAKQNRQKLFVVVASIIFSVFLTTVYLLGRINLGDGNWIIIGTITFVGFVGGVIPIVDAWGGMRDILPSGNRHK